jgi:hypothetical protein
LDHNDLREAWDEYSEGAANTLKNFLKAVVLGALTTIVGIVTDSLPILLLSVAITSVLVIYYGIPLVKDIIADHRFLKAIDRQIAKLKD